MTLFGSWKLFSTLPFPIQVKLCSSHPDNEYKQGALQHKVLALDQDGSLPSIVGTEAEVDGVMFRTMDEGSWSKVYPMTCGQNCNRPQLLVEVCIMCLYMCHMTMPSSTSFPMVMDLLVTAGTILNPLTIGTISHGEARYIHSYKNILHMKFSFCRFLFHLCLLSETSPHLTSL